MRISSPPTMFPCYYGIDTPTRQELIASSHNIEEIRKYITADTLGYITLEGVRKVVDRPINYCVACFSGDYPVPFPGEKMLQLDCSRKSREPEGRCAGQYTGDRRTSLLLFAFSGLVYDVAVLISTGWQ